jgi:hypothetical protein
MPPPEPEGGHEAAQVHHTSWWRAGRLGMDYLIDQLPKTLINA